MRTFGIIWCAVFALYEAACLFFGIGKWWLHLICGIFQFLVLLFFIFKF